MGRPAHVHLLEPMCTDRDIYTMEIIEFLLYEEGHTCLYIQNLLGTNGT